MKFVEFSTNSHTKDKGFWVSDESYDLVKDSNWYVWKVYREGTPQYRVVRNASKEERQAGWSCQITVYRFILKLKGKENKHIIVDHKNGWLDNTLESLRPTTHTNNVRYCKPRNRNIKSHLPKGVCIKAGRKNLPYYAQIGVNHKNICLGYFATPELAHEAYCKAALQYFGEYAKFN